MAPSHYLNQCELIKKRFFDIHLRAVSQEVLEISILGMSLKITYLISIAMSTIPYCESNHTPWAYPTFGCFELLWGHARRVITRGGRSAVVLKQKYVTPKWNLTVNMLNCFKEYKRYFHILNCILNLAWPKQVKLTLEHQHTLPVQHNQYHAYWCSGDFRSQSISRHDTDP